MISKLKEVFSSKHSLNIGDIFKHFYYVLSLFGLFPFGLKYKSSKNCFAIVRSAIYINSVCAATYIFILFTFYIIFLQYLFDASEVSSLSNVLITQTNYILELSTLFIYCNVAYIFAFVNRYRYVKILNNVSSIFSKSKNDQTNRKKILKRLQHQVQAIVLGSLLFVLILQLCVNCTRGESLWKIILVTFSFILPQMIQMVGLAFHYVLVMMLTAILTDINQQILKLVKQTKPTEDLFIKTYARESSSSLRHLQDVYSRAFEVKTDVNAAFQAPLLISTIQCFHCIVSESYSLYHGFVAGTHTTHNTINNTLWIVYQLLKIYCLAYSGDMLSKEAMKVGQTLHNIPTDEQDMRTLMEIQHFSSSMKYQEFEMTVYGYFSLNATLIASVVSTSAMYLIIFVQFDRSSLIY